MYFRQKKLLEILELTRLFFNTDILPDWCEKKLILKPLKIKVFKFFWQSFMLRSVSDFYPIMIAQDAKLPYNETFSVLFFLPTITWKKNLSLIFLVFNITTFIVFSLLFSAFNITTIYHVLKRMVHSLFKKLVSQSKNE